MISNGGFIYVFPKIDFVYDYEEPDYGVITQGESAWYIITVNNHLIIIVLFIKIIRKNITILLFKWKITFQKGILLENVNIFFLILLWKIKSLPIEIRSNKI